MMVSSGTNAKSCYVYYFVPYFCLNFWFMLGVAYLGNIAQNAGNGVSGV